MIPRIFAWLGRHPLVWVIPVLFWISLASFVYFKLAAAPQTEFIYDIRS